MENKAIFKLKVEVEVEVEVGPWQQLEMSQYITKATSILTLTKRVPKLLLDKRLGTGQVNIIVFIYDYLQRMSLVAKISTD